ncbi:MAG: AAA family ATPase [Deltaproteobacteria bacterium]|nr:AAA family ATPase [Deltaproteobacteria bacterium]
MEARGTTDGERKTITALFADLKGSTALIEGLDPEEARAIIDPALQLMMDAVHRYEGYVAQALGDGIFALFGAPIAHEDHPQRALYAALRMQEAMRRYSDKLRLAGGAPLQLRVGVNTGEVVVRSIRKEDLHTDYVPVGHSTNLAARMEQMATPGSILATEYTQKLTDGYFAFKELGAATIKGVDAPLNVYEVLGAGPLRTRLQLSARRGLSRFVGRQSEFEQMKRALAHAQAGHGQVVGVMGEPGVGKSRLFYEFRLTSQSACLVLEAYSVSHGKASPYLPLIELLKSYFDITLEDDERKRREKIGGKVLMLDRSLEDTLPYLFSLLGIEDQQSSLLQMDLQIRRRTFDAIKKLFLRESLNQPLLLIFEDLHWIDTETQGFLDTLSESVASARILVLVNYRPEYRHEWGSKTYYTQLRLAPLGKEEAEELLTFLLGTDPHLKPLKLLILAKTEGTPFFMEEVVQELFEQGILVRDPTGRAKLRPGHSTGNALAKGKVSPASSDLHIPTTVQGVLAARIDRLGPEEKALLQQLAIIGREFPVGLVKQVVSQSEDELYQLLSSLQHKEFLYEQPAFPEVEYIFKHALTQEVTYNSVLQERRKALHEQTAHAMETLYSTNLEDHYNELAHHYSRSGNTEKAIEYLQKAGQQAAQRSSYVEAIDRLTTAVNLLHPLPGTPERARQELALQITLGTALQATKGYGAPELEKAYSRARELYLQVGEDAQLFPILWGLFVYYVVRGVSHTAHEVTEQSFALAQDLQDPALLLVAHTMMGVTAWHDDLLTARAHIEHAIALYDPEQHRSLAFRYGQDLGVLCLCYMSLDLWMLGYPDQALAKVHEALTLARSLAHPFSLVEALVFVAQIHQHRREEQAIQEQVGEAILLGTEQGIPFWVTEGIILQGWALAEQGQAEEGIAQIRQGWASLRAAGVETWWSHRHDLLAEAYGKVGQIEEGLNVLAEALALVSKTGERIYEAELYRLKGALTLQSKTSSGQVSDKSRASQDKSAVTNPQSPIPNPQTEAEAYFHQAIAIARRQQAKSPELRAVMSLARLWQQQGKKDEARQMLSDIYHWFTEGFTTKDLQGSLCRTASREK